MRSLRKKFSLSDSVVNINSFSTSLKRKEPLMRAVNVIFCSLFVICAGMMSCSKNPASTNVDADGNSPDECVWVSTVGTSSGEVIAVVKVDDRVYLPSETSSQVLGFNSSNWWTGTSGSRDDSIWVHEISNVKKEQVYTFTFKGTKSWGDTSVLSKSQYWLPTLHCLAVKVDSHGKAVKTTASEIASPIISGNGDTARVVDSVIIRTTIYINVHDTLRLTDTVTITRTVIIRDSVFVNNPTTIRDTIYIDRTVSAPLVIVSATSLSNGNYSCVVGYSFRKAFAAVGNDYFEQGLPAWDGFRTLSSAMTSDSLRTITVTLKNRSWYTTGYGASRTQWAVIPSGAKYAWQGSLRFWFENGKAWEDSTMQSSVTVRDTIRDTVYINHGSSPRIQAVKLFEVVQRSDGTYDCRFGFLDTLITGWKTSSSYAERGLPNWSSTISLNSGRTTEGYRTAWINMPKYFHGAFGYYAVGGSWADTSKLRNSDYWVAGQASLGFDFYKGNLYQYGGVMVDTVRINNRDSVIVTIPGKSDTLRVRDTLYITNRVVDTVRIIQNHVDTVYKPLVVRDTIRMNDTLRIIQTRVDTLRIVNQRIDTIKTTVVRLDTVYVPQDVVVSVDKDTLFKVDTSVTNPVTVYLDPDSLVQSVSRDSIFRRYTVVITNTTRNRVLTTRVDTLGGASITVVPFYRDTINNVFKLVEVGEEGSGDHLVTIGLTDKVFKYASPAETSAKMFGYLNDWTTGIGNWQHSNGMYLFRISSIKDGTTFDVNFRGSNGTWAASNIMSRSQYFKNGNITFKFNGTTNTIAKN